MIFTKVSSEDMVVKLFILPAFNLFLDVSMCHHSPAFVSSNIESFTFLLKKSQSVCVLIF